MQFCLFFLRDLYDYIHKLKKFVICLIIWIIVIYLLISNSSYEVFLFGLLSAPLLGVCCYIAQVLILYFVDGSPSL